MAHIFPAILKSVNLSQTSRKITFELSPEHYSMYKDILSEEPGAQCLLSLYLVGDEEDEITKGYTDSGHQKKVFLKKIYAIIGDYSAQTGVTEAKIKELLKLRLQAKDLIKDSLSELDEHSGAIAIYILQLKMTPDKVDYDKHKED